MITLLTAAIALAAPTPGPSVWLPERTVGSGWGLNLGFNDLAPIELEKIRSTGMKWIRRDLFWHVVEPEKGRWDWTVYDRLLADVQPLGLRTLFILCYGNGLYQEASPSTPEARAAFVRYVREAVRRYRGRGIYWEMWNEPNNHHWPPAPNVEHYIALALAVGKAFKEEAPDEVLVGPALASFDWPFIEACFRAGVLRYWDAVTVHPYRPMNPETVVEDYARLRDLIDRYAPKGKHIPILSGEWGFADINTNGEENQANWFVRQYLTNLAANVPLSIWYNWSENGPDPKNAEHHFGIVGMGPKFEDKPAIRAARGLTGTLAGYRYSKRLAIGAPEDWYLLFSRDDRFAVAAWTTGERRPLTWPAGKPEKVTGRDGETSKAEDLSERPIYAHFAPTDFWRRAAAAPELPLALSVRTPSELATALAPLRGRDVTLRTGPDTVRFRFGDDAASQLAKLPRFGDRSERPMRVIVETDGVPQGIVLRHSAPIDVDLHPGRTGAELRLTARGLSFRGDLEMIGGGRTERRKIELRPNRTQNLRVPVGLRDLRIRLSENGRTVREEGPLSLLEVPLGGATIATDGDAKAPGAASVAVATDRSVPAASASVADVRFDFGKGWKYALLNPSRSIPLPGRPLRYSVWVFGDGSGALLLMRYVDASGQTFQPDGVPVDWRGWRLVSFPLDGSTGGRWGGPNDGIQRLPMALSTIAVIDNPRGAGVRGTLRLAGPTVLTRTENSGG